MVFKNSNQRLGMWPEAKSLQAQMTSPGGDVQSFKFKLSYIVVTIGLAKQNTIHFTKEPLYILHFCGKRDR